jgi:hypothetical protein
LGSGSGKPAPEVFHMGLFRPESCPRAGKAAKAMYRAESIGNGNKNAPTKHMAKSGQFSASRKHQAEEDRKALK